MGSVRINGRISARCVDDDFWVTSAVFAIGSANVGRQSGPRLSVVTVDDWLV